MSVVVLQGSGQKPVETLDGMTVFSFPFYRYPFTGSLYRRCDADIYPSEEPSWGSRVALRAMPPRRHMVTSQNPKTREDWRLVNRFYRPRRRVFNALFDGKLKETVRRMDAVYCQARYIIPKVRELYGLQEDPGFLPNPVEVPRKRPEKAGEPTVCFLGRFDGEKRPELFFELARRFPEVRFIALGRAHSEARDQRLRQTYCGIPNLEMPGFATGDDKQRVLERSWMLINTSVSECLPVPSSRRPPTGAPSSASTTRTTSPASSADTSPTETLMRGSDFCLRTTGGGSVGRRATCTSRRSTSWGGP